MSITDYFYDLPEELIAQEPLANRAASRMLVVDRVKFTFADSEFANYPAHLRPGDVLVLNNTKVFPARLFGVTGTGANVEIFLVEQLSENRWEALARPSRRLRKRRKISFGDNVAATVSDMLGNGRVIVEFEAGVDLFESLERIGRTPLPPYIKRPRTGADADRERYQTVYASSRGAIAAPTAGLHFTSDLLGSVRDHGAEIVEVTLHVGYGTFEPVRAKDLAEHRVLPERYEVDEAAAAALNAAKSEGRRIIAVGTTTTRALETNITRFDRFGAERSLADLTITPGYRFRAVDAMLTNFHLPESSLLILVSTFAGRELIMKAYEHAVAAKYRFYSYGDCMFIT
jgi:S-adenosylmethionine:tRNA ribosyltransferase-isomerase